MRSRLRTSVKKQTIHIVIFIITIIIILGVFGTHLLVGFSVALDRLRGSDKEDIDQQNITYIAPPILDPLPTATKSNNVTISGSSTYSDNVMVNLYVNGKNVKIIPLEKDGTFVFENIELQNGENEIKAKIIEDNDKDSAFSESVRIKYLNKNPELNINNLSDGQVFKKDLGQIKISGKTDPGAKVTVNDFWTITNDDGDFYYTYTLKDGENNLKFTSTDEAGNTTIKEIKIKAE